MSAKCPKQHDVIVTPRPHPLRCAQCNEAMDVCGFCGRVVPEATVKGVIIGGKYSVACPRCWQRERAQGHDPPRPHPGGVVVGRISTKLRFDVLKRDGFRCSYCGRGPAEGAKLHVDHITPRALGGATRIDNLKAACADCNHGKSDSPLVGPRKTRTRKPSLPKLTITHCYDCPDSARWGVGPTPLADWYGHDVCDHGGADRPYAERDAPDAPPAWCPRRRGAK